MLERGKSFKWSAVSQTTFIIDFFSLFLAKYVISFLATDQKAGHCCWICSSSILHTATSEQWVHFCVSVFDTELQNVIFSYPEKQPAWEKSVVLQCLSGLISSADALEEARATSRTTRGENAPR